jgi:D-alanyl-D-alanine carboxypeptidase
VPVSVSEAEGDGAPVALTHDGITGRLWRTWTGDYLTDHPDLRLYPLHLVPAAADSEGQQPADEADRVRLCAYVGHYRSYSPWFTNFRIVLRDGALRLVAPGGVEAPGEEQLLVELQPGVFRIGEPEWLPERLSLVAEVTGQVILLDRDGCAYSRTFTP